MKNLINAEVASIKGRDLEQVFQTITWTKKLKLKINAHQCLNKMF